MLGCSWTHFLKILKLIFKCCTHLPADQIFYWKGLLSLFSYYTVGRRCTGDHAVCWKALLPLFSYRCIVHWWPQSLLKGFASLVFLQHVLYTSDQKVCSNGLLFPFSFNVWGPQSLLKRFASLIFLQHVNWWLQSLLKGFAFPWPQSLLKLSMFVIINHWFAFAFKITFFICVFYRFLTSLWPSKTDPLIHEATIGIFY